MFSNFSMLSHMYSHFQGSKPCFQIFKNHTTCSQIFKRQGNMFSNLRESKPHAVKFQASVICFQNFKSQNHTFPFTNFKSRVLFLEFSIEFWLKTDEVDCKPLLESTSQRSELTCTLLQKLHSPQFQIKNLSVTCNEWVSTVWLYHPGIRLG